MARALLIPDAHSSTLKPCGTLILLIGISPGAFGAGGCAIGDSGESAMVAGCPCFQVGGGAGGCPCAPTSMEPATRMRAIRMSGALKRSRMMNLRQHRMSWRDPNPRTPPCQWPVLTHDRAVIACARYEPTSRRLQGRLVIARLLFLLVLLAWPALGRAQTPEAP